MADGNGTPGAVSFVELFNARCTELGLLDAADVAARICAVHPSAGAADLTRTVRNWQAGRNLPRSDFYRLLLDALEIDESDRRLRWHPAYGAAKARARSGTARAGADAQVAPAAVAATAESEAAPASPPIRPGRGWWAWSGLAALAAMLAMGAVLVAGHREGRAAGLSCDALAGAAWDPQGGAEGVGFRDIRAGAIDACGEAVRRRPDEGRYWFQLGRAHDRDARWHGDHAAAYEAFRRADALGHAAASLSLGILHEDGVTGSRPGEASKPDFRQAAAYYERAAGAGLPGGLYCHAIATLFGWSGARPDPAIAVDLARMAAEAGSRRALGLVGDLEARSPRTRHTACSQELGSAQQVRLITW